MSHQTLDCPFLQSKIIEVSELPSQVSQHFKWGNPQPVQTREVAIRFLALAFVEVQSSNMV
jgi:hypothetical protein